MGNKMLLALFTLSRWRKYSSRGLRWYHRHAPSVHVPVFWQLSGEAKGKTMIGRGACALSEVARDYDKNEKTNRQR